MPRLIDANELWGQIYKLAHKHGWKHRTNIAFRKCLDAITFSPTVDAEPVRHGRWVEDSTRATFCSECGQYLYDDGEYRIADWQSDYCPHCGAKMDEGREDE